MHTGINKIKDKSVCRIWKKEPCLLELFHFISYMKYWVLLLTIFFGGGGGGKLASFSHLIKETKHLFV